MATMNSLRESITRRLGRSAVQIELQQADLDVAIGDALKKLARWLPREGFETVSISKSIQRYVIDKPGIMAVTDCHFFGNVRIDQTVPGHLQIENWTQFQTLMMSMEEAQRTYSVFPEWSSTTEFNTSLAKDEVILYTYFTDQSYLDPYLELPTHAGLRYLAYYTANDDVNTGVGRLRYDLLDWVEEYATACAREMLGDIRGKYIGIPGPDGNNLEIDASSQIERARDDRRRLEDDMLQRSRQMPLIID